ncbi:MAG: hypothetical protein L3V56_13360 [Candidatus Magnetoovum sp. WYHC-5]|nr:hypothetical protein [Candidatus Magnetoovum sp. WYHC-5]
MFKFEDLVDLSAKYMELQKGKWDNSSWMDFLLNMQKVGYDINAQFQSQLSAYFDSVKDFYKILAATRGVESVMDKIKDEVVNFVKQKNGVWSHSDWEEFLASLNNRGLELTDETVSYLGGLLEAVKSVYGLSVTKEDSGKSGE